MSSSNRESKSGGYAIGLDALDSLSDGLLVLDEDWRIAFVNRRGIEFLACEGDRAVGRVGWDVLPDPLISARAEIVEARSAGRRVALAPASLANGETVEIVAFPSESGLAIVLKSIPRDAELLGGKDLAVGSVGAFEDVAERKRVERDARRLASIVDSSQDAIIGKALDGTITSWNRGAERLYGYSSEEAIGRNVCMLAPPERTGEPVALLERIRAGEHVGPFETVRLRKDGEPRIVLLTVSPVRDESGTIVEASAIARDVTTKRKAEEALRQSEQRFRIAAQSVSDILYDLDLRTNALEWFGDVDGLLGYEPGGFPHSLAAWERAIHPDDRGRVVEALSRSIDAKELFTAEYRVERADGSWRRWIDKGTVLVGSDGTALRLIGAVTDVTAQREAEAALQLTQRRLQSVLDHSPALIYIKDLEGRFLLVNRPYEALVHASPGSVVGKTDFDYFPREMCEVFRANDLQVIRSQSPLETEEVVLLDDGLHTFLSIKFPLVGENGDPYAVCGISTDITDRKRAQRRLLAFADELARSNRDLEEFASIASHDLQEPLRKIQTLADRLASRYATALDDSGLDYLARLRSAADRMRVLIESLLTFSRVTTRASACVPVDLTAVVREVVSDLETLIDETGAIVDVDTLPVLEADPVQMRQLFQNLIGNALKYRRADTPPRIQIASESPAPDEAPEPSSQQRYRISVSDNGIGFDAKYAERIFGLFQRLHGRNEYPGTGIGLAICRKIVERHGGTATAASVPGAGSTFTITLPAKQLRETESHA